MEWSRRDFLNTAQRGYVLETGEIVLEDESASLLQDDERMRGAYLGARVESA